MNRALPFGFAALVPFLALTSCADHDHVGEVPFYQFAITEDTPAFFEGEDASFFLVEQRVELTLDPPSDAEMNDLSAEAPAPFPRMPWAEKGDYAIEIDWALINLDDQTHSVFLSFNGINEFNEYVPGVQEGEEEIIPDLSQWERTIELGPQERRSGTVREAELEEVAVDLATVVNGAPNANQIVHPENHSASDPRSQMYIPEVIPALVGVRAGLGMSGDAPGNLVLELTVRVRDESDKIVEFEDAWELPAPTPFTPEPVEL
jgi:hypothetical protein